MSSAVHGRYLENGVEIKERVSNADDYLLVLYAHETADAEAAGNLAAKLRGVDNIIGLLTNVQKPKKKHRLMINDILHAAKRLNQQGELEADVDAGKKLLSVCSEISVRVGGKTVWEFMQGSTGEETAIMVLHLALHRLEKIQDYSAGAHPSTKSIEELKRIREELNNKIREWSLKPAGLRAKVEELEQPDEHSLLDAVFGGG